MLDRFRQATTPVMPMPHIAALCGLWTGLTALVTWYLTSR